MTRINKINWFSFGIFQAALLAFIGLLCGMFYSFGGAIYDVFTVGMNRGTALAFLALIGMPLLFGAFGFVLGIIEATLYNLFTNWFRGLELDFN